MHKDTDSYFLSCFLELSIQRIKRTGEKYGFLPRMDEVIRFLRVDAKKQLDEIQGRISKISFTPEQRNKIIAIINDYKTTLDASDYLFLKMAACEDLQESKHFAGMAQTLNPDNEYLYIFLNVDWESDRLTFEICKAVEECPISPKDKQTGDFFEIVRITNILRFTDDTIPVRRIRSMINKNDGFARMLYSIFYDCKEYRDPQEMIRSVDQMKFTSIVEWHQFELLKCFFYYKTGNYAEAMKLFKPIEIELLSMQDWEEVEYLNLGVHIYDSCGHPGKAILLAKEILRNDEFRASGHDAYYNTVLTLAAIHTRYSRCDEARKILLADRAALDVIQILFHSEYLKLKGDICLAENKTPKAIRFYKKSLELEENPELREKVVLLEADLYF